MTPLESRALGVGIGIDIGVATVAIASVALSIPASVMIGFVIAAGVAVPLGWHRTVRRALASDDAVEASVSEAAPLAAD